MRSCSAMYGVLKLGYELKQSPERQYLIGIFTPEIEVRRRDKSMDSNNIAKQDLRNMLAGKALQAYCASPAKLLLGCYFGNERHI